LTGSFAKEEGADLVFGNNDIVRWFMLFGGVSEVLETDLAQELLASLHYPVYLNYILGIAEIIGAVVLIQWRFKTIKECAYAGFTIDILGTAASSYFVDGIGPAIFTAAG
jgi:hypothetical protein